MQGNKAKRGKRTFQLIFPYMTKIPYELLVLTKTTKRLKMTTLGLDDPLISNKELTIVG